MPGPDGIYGFMVTWRVRLHSDFEGATRGDFTTVVTGVIRNFKMLVLSDEGPQKIWWLQQYQGETEDPSPMGLYKWGTP